MTAIANLPDLRPSLLLDFANSGRVDPRIQCTRASSATCFGPDGKLRTVAANVPRIDYDPATGKCLGLLVEEQRTNLWTHSAVASASTFAVTAQDYTLSFYGDGEVALTGVHIGNSSAGTVQSGRRVLTFTPSVGSLTCTPSGDVRNVQLEAGSFPTSYIPTEGTAVTRAADYITMGLSRDYLNKGSVLISADIPALGGNPSPKLIMINNPSVDSFYEIVDAANGISASGYNGATYTFSRTASFGRSRELRAVLSWSGKDVVLGLNGDVLEVTQIGMPVPPLSQLRVLTAGASSSRMSCGWVRGIAIYADYTNAAQVARLTA